MKQPETKIFFSPSVYLSAALVLLLNSQSEFDIVNGKVLFGFPLTDAHYRAMAEYNSELAINALEFTQAIGRLRSEMLLRRSMASTGCTRCESLPPMDPTTGSGLINYKEALLNLDCTISASSIVDCIDFIVVSGKEVLRG